MDFYRDLEKFQTLSLYIGPNGRSRKCPWDLEKIPSLSLGPGF